MRYRRLMCNRVTASALLLLASCNIDVFPNTGTSSTPLDEADASVGVNQQAGAAEATVTACITDDRGRTVELEGGQAVAVNGQALTGPDASGNYTQTVAVAAEYTVTVNEPTRGVSETTIAVPGGCDITAPAAGATVSLSGFAITWSNADAALQVEVTLTQTIFGTQRTENFGPFTDTGSLTLDNNDLRTFQQGAGLLITLTRTRQRVGINGFNSATLSSQVWQSVTATPGP